jgi:tRNA-dihydrouridine synthase
MGNQPNEIRETIVVLYETFGYEHFNWNIGCPMNQIVRKKRGCGVMPYSELIEEVANEVCGKTSFRFSLKMRLGLHSAEEGLAILEKLAPYPIDFLCIHPRLGTQRYEGNVDLDIFEQFYQTTNHKIVYSGDINDVDFFVHLQNSFPKIKNWMLGRGVLMNPFLAEEIVNFAEGGISTSLNLQKRKAESKIVHKEERFLEFYIEYSEILLALKGERIALSSLKELWHYFAFFWKLDATALQKLLQINDYQMFFSYVKNKIFATHLFIPYD